MFICKNLKSWKKRTFRPVDSNFQAGFEALVVLVFKTSLESKDDIARIKPSLESSPAIKKWSVDRNDSDNVLRVVGKGLHPEKVIALVKAKGYQCKVLP